ncbi:hypothetical protein TUM4636_24500 [Shewanella glacialipiscicola]|uniref:Uncharacterized protein n=1 Tax=Shewanella glacialipiscicola TaxID=614069 RepID=A0ABQ6J2L5_9GAMM|nr:hypothetical protein TUM4636_24500 [Shewanella glacialipiscicola]GMA82373.1 hypothetical protein GCM10025855_19060 [Shewanella glacialipiscicola]
MSPYVLDIERIARQFKLDGKRERAYPRVLKMSKNKYPVRPNENAVHLRVNGIKPMRLIFL